jgi:hypothetical protein
VVFTEKSLTSEHLGLSSVERSDNNEREKVWMEAVVAELKAISQCFDELSGTNHTAVSLTL